MSTEARFHDYDVILAPVQTERSNQLVDQHNQHVFLVKKTATKPQIKAAVERIFGVQVMAVNTLIRKGKNRTFRGRVARLQDTKRAIVRLKPGEKIDYITGGQA